jgi:hypothetical protein
LCPASRSGRQAQPAASGSRQAPSPPVFSLSLPIPEPTAGPACGTPMQVWFGAGPTEAAGFCDGNPDDKPSHRHAACCRGCCACCATARQLSRVTNWPTKVLLLPYLVLGDDATGGGFPQGKLDINLPQPCLFSQPPQEGLAARGAAAAESSSGGGGAAAASTAGGGIRAACPCAGLLQPPQQVSLDL